jgi:uncharacterized protein
MSGSRRVLPLLPSPRHGSRSLTTCHYKCGNACDHPDPNRSGNETMQQIVERTIARRAVLQAGAVAGGAMVVETVTAGQAFAHDVPDRITGRFKPVTPNTYDLVVVPTGYLNEVIIRWGDRLLPGSPPFDVMHQTAEAAASQFGYNNDYIGVLQTSRTRALMVCNHEYTNPELMFPEGVYDAATKIRIEMASHGMSVVELHRRTAGTGRWVTVPVRRARRNRRITASTPFRLDGPAAGDERLRTTADPAGRTVLGTLNNCAGGVTPWGTVLSGEENFNQYFDLAEAPDPEYSESYARYTINGVDTRGWGEVDRRFDVSREPHEPFRFGWVVEVDPSDPTSTPRKHTMLGRFKHEGANIAVAEDGRVAAYMGDDQRGDYIYKFVSRDRFRRGRSAAARRHNLRLLQHGTLYVARFSGDGLGDDRYDGTGRWIPLASDEESFVDGMSVADVLIDTRLAADAVGATAMDRPEDIEPNPVNGRIYCALTNNSQRGTVFPVDEANPLGESQVRESLAAPLTTVSGNRNGYVLEIDEGRDGHTGRRFRWQLMLVCGDPDAPETYFAGFPKDKVSPISSPDNVAFDWAGNLWIATDGNALGSNDGIFRVPVRGPQRGHLKQFLTVPPGAEACGPFISRDGRTLWTAVQHPGEGDEATFEDPLSTWPHTDTFPRPSVTVTYRD